MNHKIFITFIISLIFVVDCFGQTNITPQIKQTAIGGVGLGSLIAAITSWERSKSILFAILHACLGWIYVIYFALTRTEDEQK